MGLADVAAESEARVQKILNVIIAALEVWLEGLLNPVSDAIDYVVAKLGEIESRLAGIRDAVNDAISLGTVQIGNYVAMDLQPRAAYTQAKLDAHGERVAAYARDVALVNLGEIDWDLGLQNLPTQGT